ncbi:MAG TPA: amidohydrolase/deacetylase family metallohydrolase, partial [Candidatus Binatia bacterium]|nr:amidohydrolase/deacetylase family metallohydrolase [Candidatus Binatia bacterium]
MDRQLTDFILKAGRVLDPASGRHGLFDIRVKEGVVEQIGPDLSADGATVLDVKGLIITPGLIDVHPHLMKGMGAHGADP